MKITKLTYNKIDFSAYDKCIETSKFGTVYAMSWYLDIVSPSWSVLMADNYAFVMPLPQKKKYGINYLTQPYFCQQLGLFSNQEISESVFNDFISAIPHQYYNLQLNNGNVFNQEEQNLRLNLVLGVNCEYAEIKATYRSNCKRNLKKAEKEDQEISQIDNIEEYIKFLDTHTDLEILSSQKALVQSLLIKAKEKNALEIHVSKEKTSNQIIAGVIFLKWKNRYYYMFPVSSQKGKEWQSMTLIIDRLIKENCEKNIILDFEGSSIEGVARFYYGFGAVATFFPILYKKPFNLL